MNIVPKSQNNRNRAAKQCGEIPPNRIPPRRQPPQAARSGYNWFSPLALLGTLLALGLNSPTVQGDELNLEQWIARWDEKKFVPDLDLALTQPLHECAAHFWDLATNPYASLAKAPFTAWLQKKTKTIPSNRRWMVALAAGRMKIPDAIPPLETWLREADRDPDNPMDATLLRETILYSLGELGTPEALPVLNAYVHHPDEWTRFFVHEAISKLNNQPLEFNPLWPGSKDLRFAVVGAAAWEKATHFFYRDRLAKEFERGVLADFFAPNPYRRDWGGDGMARCFQSLTFDREGRPNFTLLVVHKLMPYQTHPAFMWRLYHYARRGGRLILDVPSMFWGADADRQNNQHLYAYARYIPGPWNRLFPDRFEQNPQFPSLDGVPPHPPTVRTPPSPKDLYYGYQPIGRGGVLMVSENPTSLEASVNRVLSGWELESPSKGLLEPSSPDLLPALQAALSQLFAWLTEGPAWKIATIDWRNEPRGNKPTAPSQADPTALNPASVPPVERPLIEVGRPFPAKVAVTFHQDGAGLIPVLSVFNPRGDKAVEMQGPKVDGKRGNVLHETIHLMLPDESEMGLYTLMFALNDSNGNTLHAWTRSVDVQGRFRLTLAAPPILGDNGPPIPWPSPNGLPIEDAKPGKTQLKFPPEDSKTYRGRQTPIPLPPITLHIVDPRPNSLPNGEVRLALVNEDSGRCYKMWRKPWPGTLTPAAEVLFDIAGLLPPLPPGQYAWTAELGDAQGRTYARTTAPLAVPAHYRDRHVMLWQEWASYTATPEGPEPRRKIGLNTTHGYGNFLRVPGFPYEYAILQPPSIRIIPEALGNQYLDNTIADTERARWIQQGVDSRANARAMAVNLIEEASSISWRNGRPVQYIRLLQDRHETLAALNRHLGTELASWEELRYTLADTPEKEKPTDGFPFLFGTNRVPVQHALSWLFYTSRDAVLRMHGDWLREGNPYLHIEPGMGAGGPFYDCMHMRGYPWNRMEWFPIFRQGWLAIHGRAPMTWLLGMASETRFPTQARVVWSAVAAGGRNILVYAPGDTYGRKLFNPDGSRTESGQTYAEVIASVRPYEPALCYVQNAVHPQVLNLGTDGLFLEALFRMGIQPNQSSDPLGQLLILDAGGMNINDSLQKTLRQAVENGATLLTTANGTPAVAAAFGVRIRDAAARGEPTMADLAPLAALIPGVEGLRIKGKQGPAIEIEPSAKLSETQSLIFGMIGKGRFVFLKIEPEITPENLPNWAAFLEALLRQVGIAAPGKVLDTLGRVDNRFMCHTLNTDDDTQRYLLVQANDTLDGSLSSWGIENRSDERLAQWPVLPDSPDPSAPITLRWTQTNSADAVLWVKRRVGKLPNQTDWAARFFLTRDGQPIPAPSRKSMTQQKPTPIAHLRAFPASREWLWEAVGPSLKLEDGVYELRMEKGDESVEVQEVWLLPARITAHVALGDPSIRRLYDMKRDVSYPVQTQGEIRFVEIPLRAGEGAVLSLLEEPASILEVRVETATPQAGRSMKVEGIVRRTDGQRIRRSHTLEACLLDGQGQPISNTLMRVLTAQGRAVFDFWIADSDPRGPTTLAVFDRTAGVQAAVNLTILPPSRHDEPVRSLTAQWNMDALLLRGRSHSGTLHLQNRSGKSIHLEGVALATGGCDGLTATVAQNRWTIPPEGSADLPFALTLDPTCEEGPALMRLTAANASLDALEGYPLLVPPVCEFEMDDFPDLRVPDVGIVELSGRVRNRTTAPLTVTLDLPLPSACFPDGGNGLRVETTPGKWTPFRIAAIITRDVARQARERDLSLPVRLLGPSSNVLARARPRLLINPWDVEPPTIGVSTGGAAILTIFNGTTVTRNVRIKPILPNGWEGQTTESLLAIPPSKMEILSIPCKPIAPEVQEGLYTVSCTVALDSGMEQVYKARVRLRTESPWWIWVQQNIFTAQSTIRVNTAQDQKSRDTPDNPWQYPSQVFTNREPPKEWSHRIFHSALAFDDPLPPPHSLITAATQVYSEREQNVTFTLGYESSRFLLLGNTVIEDRRQKGDQKPPVFFQGRVWLNETLLYDHRPALTLPSADSLDILPASVQQTGRLHLGTNRLVVQHYTGVKPQEESGKVYLFFQDSQTGKRVPIKILGLSETNPPSPRQPNPAVSRSEGS